MVGLVLFGFVWFGLIGFGLVCLVWFGLVWFGLEWHGLVWYGLVGFGLWWLRVWVVWVGEMVGVVRVVEDVVVMNPVFFNIYGYAEISFLVTFGLVWTDYSIILSLSC